MTNIKSTFFQGRSAPYAANCYSWLKSITPLNTIQDPQSDVEKPYCGRQCPDLLIRPPVYNPYDILVHMSLSYPFGTQVTSLIVGIQSTTGAHRVWSSRPSIFHRIRGYTMTLMERRHVYRSDIDGGGGKIKNKESSGFSYCN